MLVTRLSIKWNMHWLVLTFWHWICRNLRRWSKISLIWCLSLEFYSWNLIDFLRSTFRLFIKLIIWLVLMDKWKRFILFFIRTCSYKRNMKFGCRHSLRIRVIIDILYLRFCISLLVTSFHRIWIIMCLLVSILLRLRAFIAIWDILVTIFVWGMIITLDFRPRTVMIS